MFRVGGFCEDKNVAKVLRALQGLMIGQPELVPVVGAEVRDGKVVAANGGGSLLDMFHTWCIDHKKISFQAQDAKAFCREVGKPENAYGNLINRGRNLGMLRKLKGKGKHTEYEWTSLKKGKRK